MPELPEVESLANNLAAIITHRTLESATFFRSNLREKIPQNQFQKILTGQSILQVSRRSKYMLWQTPAGYGIFHLGMSGNMFCFPTAEPQKPHTHAVFTFKPHGQTPPIHIHFVDPRRFGMISCCDHATLLEQSMFANLGPEPLVHPYLGRHLAAISATKRVPVKVFLMDATNVVGVGNIYASESLFRAGVDPRRPASSLNPKEWDQVAHAIQETLKAAIAAGGTSFRDFRHNDGSKGYFAVDLKVYGRDKKPCVHCGNPIDQITQGGRSTFYCTFCQT